MPVPEALTVVAAALTIAKSIYALTIGIHDWIDGVKYIDKTVRDLGDEVVSLRDILQHIEKALSSETVRQAACLEDEESHELWYSLFATLQDCHVTIDSLVTVLVPLKTSSTNAILRKFKLDLKDLEVTTIREQLTFHSRRLQMSIQMVHLRVSCFGPSLVTTHVDSKMDKLYSLIQSQGELLMELARKSFSAARDEVDQENFNVYAKALDRSALKLLSSSASMYSGSHHEGSVTDSGNLSRAVQEWVKEVPLSAASGLDSSAMLQRQSVLSENNLVRPSTVDELQNREESILQPDTSMPSSDRSTRSTKSDWRSEYLFSKGFNVEALDFDPRSALSTTFLWHVRRKQTPTKEMESGIQLMIGMCPTPSPLIVQGNYGDEIWMKDQPLLNIACLQGWDGIVLLLLQRGASPNHGLIRPLYCAASLGNLAIVKELVIRGADLGVKTVDQRSKSALHIAIENGHVDVVKVLLEHGASISDPTDLHRLETPVRPLQIAIKSDRPEMIETLLDAGAKFEDEFMTKYGRSHGSALHYACRKACVESVRFLIGRDEDVKVKDKDGDTPLEVAVKLVGERGVIGTDPERQLITTQKYKDIINMLLDGGAVLNRSSTAAIKRMNKRIEVLNEVRAVDISQRR